MPANKKDERLTRAASGELERRFYEVQEIRADEGADGKRKIVGHAAVFDKETLIGGWLPFREVIRAGAFDRVIAEDHDVRSLWNHDANRVLGRTPKTLTLSVDSRGLMTETDPPDTTYAHDLITLIDRGDVSGMSFAFRVTQEKWTFDEENPENDIREILEVSMHDGDISPVTFPAYTQTDVGMRAADMQRASDEHKRARFAALGDGQEPRSAESDEGGQELDLHRAMGASAAFSAGVLNHTKG